MMVKKETLAEISRFFETKEEVVAVYLYGSQAKKMTTAKSDLDLAVLLGSPHGNLVRILELGVELQKLLGNVIQVDLREIHLGLSPVFLGEVISQSEVLFCRDEEARVEFEVQAMRIIDDSEKIQRINLYYLQKALRENTYGKASENSTEVA